ncbi:class I SAM-dependent methyltransferase [Amycolatopsis oliviviridis]|uniref:Methyltransferase type 11 n=1 Tax=Amycolatopsis oliviviridis TaxID=1471590 RepID=A0ABQ3M9K9_9PSEU|nr:class I SAM-dependent methyltransferase [Amycolatopsis oliviviridis]GHH32362.1 methyltransferase type 11 [Amycolatopsis oliviviridis]
MFGRNSHSDHGRQVRLHYQDPRFADDYAQAYRSGPSERYFASRLYAIAEILRSFPSGDLLDVGCGPGMMVHHLLGGDGGRFRITACDQSAAMIDIAARGLREDDKVRLHVADIGDLPFPGGSFDIVLAMGVLEYVDADRVLREITRVTKPGGFVVITMLNPLSPYRLFEWGAFWPARRLLGRLEGLLGVPEERRHRADKSGIHALPASRLVGRMRESGLRPHDVLFYDITALVPPFDRLVRPWTYRWRYAPERTVSRGPGRWLGSGYLVVAQIPAESRVAEPVLRPPVAVEAD